MNFIDHTGHIFSLPSYSNFPAGYEYDEQPYIFWLNESNKLSVNNYYIKPIRILLDEKYVINNNSRIELRIKLESNNYKLLGSYHINNFINQAKNIFDYITISSDRKYWDGHNYDTISNIQENGYVEFDLLKNELTEDDVICITNLIQDTTFGDTVVTNKFSMITFYVVGYSSEEQVLLSNILISLHDKGKFEYCPITVGGEFMDESEPLVINGKNMGINIPKTIIRAFYDTSFYNYNADEVVYNNKLKELLLNYMGIKGECGNYDSAIKSLQWFGWGDKIKLSKLVQTDNEFINQYIIDNFDINNDTLTTFKHFANTTFIRLSIAGTKISDEVNPQEIILDSDIIDDTFTWGGGSQISNIHETFWGEGKPKIINLIDDIVTNTYDEGDINFYKPYYNYLFQELGLKLAALEYFYSKYFLPIHLFIHSSTISHQCFMNDTKLLVGENKTFFTANPVINYDLQSNISVKFPSNNFVMYYTQQHIIDDNYNEFTQYISNVDELSKSMDLYWVNENCLSIPIKFSSKNKKQYYRCKLVLEKIDKILYDYEYSFNNEHIDNKKYNEFLTELKNTGSLKYDLIHYNDILSLNCIDTEDKNIDNIIISHQKFTQVYNTQTLELSDEWDEYRTVKQFKQYIKENYLDFLLFGQDLPYFNIKIKSEKYIKHMYVGNNDFISLTNVSVIDDNHTLIYESAFDFIQDIDDNNTHYNKFVIIPKIINKQYDINFWLNSEFNLYLSVNGQWFTYNFNCIVPEFQINLGKLKYKYYLDSTDAFESQHGNVSLFKQLSYLDEKNIKFNTFMWQPDFVRVNNIDFFDNLLEYYKNNKYNILYNADSKTLLTDIELNNTNINTDINDDDVYYILQINNQKIYIHIEVIQKYLLDLKNKYIALDVNMLTKENREHSTFVYYSSSTDSIDYQYIFNESLTDTENYIGSSGSMNNTEDYENFLFAGEDSVTYSFDGINKLQSHIFNNKVKNDDNFIFIYEDEIVNDGNKYIIIYFELNSDNTIKFFITSIYGNKYYLQIFKSIYKNKTYLYNKYKEQPNIINNKEYINKVHQYYIYKNNSNELLKYEPNSDIDIKQYEIDLYNKFFNKDESLSSRINIPNGEEIYDFYLMHDNEYWYALFITKLPVTKYLFNELDITYDKKEIIYTDYIEKIQVEETETPNGIIKNYYKINLEILENVKQQTGLQNSDLLIVYNTTDDIYNNNNTEIDNNITNDIVNTEYFNKYLINKIYNKNIGKLIDNEYADEDTDIVWNSDANDVFDYIGVNWISIPLENVICPKCGKSLYFTKLETGKDSDTFICTYITGYDENNNPIYCNYEYTKTNNSVIYWNDLGIPYKMVYSIVDDIYNEETNPTGKYHEELLFKHDKYMFSMNNIPFYLLYDETINSYYLGNNVLNNGTNAYYDIYSKYNKTQIFSYYNSYTMIPDKIYDMTTYSYKGNIVEIKTGNETPEYYTIIEGLKYDDIYYSYINDIIIYTKNNEEYIEKNNDFYILYDGKYVYNKGWDLSINISSESLDINDIVKIHSIEDNKELQWAINPQYNFNPYNPDTISGIYVYKMPTQENYNRGFYIKCTFNDVITNIDKPVYLKLSSVNVSNNTIYIKTKLPIIGGEININKLFIENIKIYTFNTETGEYTKVISDANIENKFIYINVHGVYWNIGTYKTYINGEIIKDNIYYINQTDYIQFDEYQKPKQIILMDNAGLLFTLVNYYDEETKKYIFKKQLVTKESITFVDNTDNEDGTLYNALSDIFYDTNYYNKVSSNEIEMVIHNNEDWMLNNYCRLGLGLNDYEDIFNANWEYDNLWYFIPSTGSIMDSSKHNWEILIYINEKIKHKNTEWYFTINGHEYKFNDMLPDGNNVKHSDIINNKNAFGVNIKLSDYNLEPICVELTLIPGTDYRKMYYDKVDFYYFKYNKSDEKFLINRMNFELTNGINHFSTNDIIAATLLNKMSKDNVDYKIEFKLDYGSKWSFVPVSLKMKHDVSIVSNSDLAIMSIGDSNIKYDRGYYDLIVNYSIDGNTQHIQTLKSRILVK